MSDPYPAPASGPAHAVEIFYAEICGLCHKALNHFQSLGVPVRRREVFWDRDRDDWVDSPTVREMLKRCGPVDFVPQIFVHGRHIPGWRTLEPMIASGELDRWLSGSSG